MPSNIILQVKFMIYLDNAATSFPKPDCMLKAMLQCARYYCGNPGRSGHSLSVMAGEKVFEARNTLAKIIGAPEAGEQIIFTSNTTQALNLAIKGVLQKGDHVVTTAMEHNSVLRPVKAMEAAGVSYSIVKARRDGSLRTGAVKEAITDNTRLVIVTAASNVTGTIMPICAIGSMIEKLNMARKKKILYLVDGAQAVGSMYMNVNDIKADMLAFPGHKGLLGPQGSGVLYVREGTQLKPLLEGGSGTASREIIQPREFPDGYEAGTVNTPGIAGLCAAAEYVDAIGINTIEDYERSLIIAFDEALRNMNKVTVYGPENCEFKTALTCFNIEGRSCEEVASVLNDEYGIAVRAGFHCAGLAHKTIGTWNTGAVRVSAGPFNTAKDIKKAAEAVWKLAR